MMDSPLKNFPFKLSEGGFGGLSNMRPGVVMEQHDLALSIRSFRSKSLIHAAQLRDAEVLVDRANIEKITYLQI